MLPYRILLTAYALTAYGLSLLMAYGLSFVAYAFFLFRRTVVPSNRSTLTSYRLWLKASYDLWLVVYAFFLSLFTSFMLFSLPKGLMSKADIRRSKLKLSREVRNIYRLKGVPHENREVLFLHCNVNRH